MKKILLLIMISWFVVDASAQKIGIGQSNPQMKIHVTHNDSALALFENTQALNNTVKNALYFKTGSWYSGGIATIGTGINTSRVSIFGYAESSPSGLKEYLSVLDNGNVGIGTNTPSSLLQVNGDIDVHGNIKVQGVAGSPGEVLRTDGGGNLSWGPISSQYENFVSFLSNTNWTVPAGVTRILIEAWGGGAGGYTNPGFVNYGGGGGGYIIAIANVTPGAILPIAIGLAGNGGSAATNGTASTVTIGSAVIQAGGGYAAPGTVGIGGNFSVTSPGTTVIGFDGEEGRDGSEREFIAIGYNGTVVMYQSRGGHGGDAGNTSNTGGISGTASGFFGNLTGYSAGDALQRARFPGGGGCVNGNNTASALPSRGAYGKVVIRY